MMQATVLISQRRHTNGRAAPVERLPASAIDVWNEVVKPLQILQRSQSAWPRFDLKDLMSAALRLVLDMHESGDAILHGTRVCFSQRPLDQSERTASTRVLLWNDVVDEIREIQRAQLSSPRFGLTAIVSGTVHVALHLEQASERILKQARRDFSRRQASLAS